MIGAGEDGSYVYFVAKGVLTAGSVQGTCPDPAEGECVNLYSDDTQSQMPRLVAVLSGEDLPGLGNGINGPPGETSP